MLYVVRQLIIAGVILLIAVFAAIFFGSLFSFPFMWVGLPPGVSMLIGVMIFQVLIVLELRRHNDSRMTWTGVAPVVGLIPYAWQRAGVMTWTHPQDT
jgi:hypothetical protein